MAVDKVFNSAMNRAVEKVNVPELKGGLLGVKAEAANKAVKEAVSETAQRVGDEILATYNRVIVSRNRDGSLSRTTLGLNEVTFEKIENPGSIAEFVSSYDRTTPRGRYIVEANENGITRTQISSPTLGTRERIYIGRKVLKPVTVDEVQLLKAKHLETRGRIVSHKEDVYRGEKSISNVFENGSNESLTFGNDGKLKSRFLYLDGDKRYLYESCEDNITTYVTKIKAKDCLDNFAPISYHENPLTGAISTLKVDKLNDDYGSPIIKASYEFPEGLKNAEIIYSQQGARFTSGRFESEKLGKVEVTPFKFIVNGEEISRNDLAKMTGRDYNSDNGQFIEAFLGKAMKEIGVSEKFLPSYKACWTNL